MQDLRIGVYKAKGKPPVNVTRVVEDIAFFRDSAGRECSVDVADIGAFLERECYSLEAGAWFNEQFGPDGEAFLTERFGARVGRAA